MTPITDQNDSCFLVYITLPAEHNAIQFARRLVANKLAAGVNIINNVRSVYSWRGEICESKEWILIAQTNAETFPQLQEEIERIHPYVTPCITGILIDKGLDRFLDWINLTLR